MCGERLCAGGLPHVTWGQKPENPPLPGEDTEIGHKGSDWPWVTQLPATPTRAFPGEKGTWGCVPGSRWVLALLVLSAPHTHPNHTRLVPACRCLCEFVSFSLWPVLFQDPCGCPLPPSGPPVLSLRGLLSVCQHFTFR